jgi:DNA-binding NarL/FixJ family response regulator
VTGSTNSAMILVVEDDKALRGDIVEELQEAGYRTAAVEDGQDALDLLAHTAPDLLLCDITMPGLDGYGLLRRLRNQHPELGTTPFVFLTALSDPREIVEGKLLGADDYLVKPVDYDLMLATVAARLRQVERIRRRHDSDMASLRQALVGLSGGGAEATLDLIALGIILLNGQGMPVHVNRAAREMAAADVIRIDAVGLRSPDPLSDRAVQRAVSETLDAAGRDHENVVGVMLEGAQDTSALSLLACALAHSEPERAGRPHVAVFISTTDRRKRVSEALLMDLLALTPTEARIAGALACGTRAADIAAEMDVSQATMSFHLRNLFQKTGTNRQADLIALILAGPMMIQSE